MIVPFPARGEEDHFLENSAESWGDFVCFLDNWPIEKMVISEVRQKKPQVNEPKSISDRDDVLFIAWVDRI